MCKCGGATSHEHGLVPETVQKKSLHPYIDFNGVTCLNAKKTHLADLPKILRATFYPALNVVLESDTDQQLLLKIRYYQQGLYAFLCTIMDSFSGLVKVKGIIIYSEADFTSPSEMKAFTNSPDLDFVSAESRPATQTWQLVAPSSITAEPIEYATKYILCCDLKYNRLLCRVFSFMSVSHLSLFFPSNFGAPKTRIVYVGLMGEFMLSKANPIITSYELVPNPSDHKAETDMASTSKIGQGF